MLTPIVYTPEVKPKKIAPKKSRIQMHGTGSVDETEETFEAAGPGQATPAGPKLPLQFRADRRRRAKAATAAGTLERKHAESDAAGGGIEAGRLSSAGYA
jgi:hypothetical protein